MAQLEIDIPNNQATIHGGKRVSFSPRLNEYGLTYSKFEYDRSPNRASPLSQNYDAKASCNDTVQFDGSWADAFLSMGRDEFSIWIQDNR